MSVEQAICPAYGTGQLAATASSASTATIPAGNKQIILTVTGAQPVYFRVTNADDTTAATTADCLVNSVNRMIVSKGEQTRISLISPGGASQVHIMGCEGFSSM
jgi:hypothetical protein